MEEKMTYLSDSHTNSNHLCYKNKNYLILLSILFFSLSFFNSNFTNTNFYQDTTGNQIESNLSNVTESDINNDVSKGLLRNEQKKTNNELVYNSIIGNGLITKNKIEDQTNSKFYIKVSTYLGGNNTEYLQNFVLDNNDAICAFGTTNSIDFPTFKALESTYGGGEKDGFLTKLDASGQIVFSTYIGGSSGDFISDLKIDSKNNIILVGWTSSSDFPILNYFDSVQNSPGLRKGFTMKFNPEGELLFSTLFSGYAEYYDYYGSSVPYDYNLLIDTDENIVLAGNTNSTDLLTKNALDSSLGGEMDGFLMKINTTGQLLFSTFIGGSLDDNIQEMVLDSNDNILLTGTTYSSDFPTFNAFDDILKGESDGFVIKFNSTGQVVYSTLIGGSDFENEIQIELDSYNNVLLTGQTGSPDFPLMNAFDITSGNDDEGFLIKMNVSGQMLFSTYIDGRNFNLAVDTTDNIILSGQASSTNFPMKNAFKPTHGGGYEIFLTKIDSTGNLNFSTYVGGSNNDFINDMKLDPSNNIILAGQTLSRDLSTYNSFDLTLGGIADLFLVKFYASGQILFSTYIGGYGWENFNSLVVDTSDNIYLAGSTSSPEFPISSALDGSFGGNGDDGFIMKFNSSGQVDLSTFIGGFGNEYIYGLKLDNEENILLLGSTNSLDFLTFNSFDNVYSGSVDEIFLMKLVPFLDSDNDNMDDVWETYYNLDITHDDSLEDSDNDGMTNLYEFLNGLIPNQDDALEDNDHDQLSNILEFSIGSAASRKDTDLDGMPDAFEYQFGLEINSNDAYEDKDNDGVSNVVEYTYGLRPNSNDVSDLWPGYSIKFGSYIGGSSWDQIVDSVIDSQGNLIVTGNTDSSDFPQINGSINRFGNNAVGSVFLMKINANGKVDFSFLIVGTSFVSKVIVDNEDNIILLGQPSSIYFPILNAFQSYSRGDAECFVMKFNSTGKILFSTYFGGSSAEWADDITIDSNDNILINGYTLSLDFPIFNAFQEKFGGGLSDAFLIKFTPTGQVVFSTFIGGSGISWERINQLLVDSNDNIILTGQTNSVDFPTKNGFQDSFSGGDDIFVLKINKIGQLIYSTFIGGSGYDNIHHMVLDKNNNIILSGSTDSLNFPAKIAFGDSFSGRHDIFLTKLNTAGEVVFSTFIGGSGEEDNDNFVLDSLDNIILTGQTYSTDFPIKNAFKDIISGDSDSFLMKINQKGVLQFSTYIGGINNDKVVRQVLDSYDNILIAIQTFIPDIDNSDYPILRNQGTYLIKIDQNGELLFFTFIVGSDDDSVNEMVVDSQNNIYITGQTSSVDFPTKDALSTHNRGETDIFILKFNSSGSLMFSSYVGGNNFDGKSKIILDNNYNIWLQFYSGSSFLPAVNAFDSSYSGQGDYFVMKFKSFVDNDNDNLDDNWEVTNELDPNIDDSFLDPDGDGLTNLEEFLYGTSPILFDTDGDGIDDGYEVKHGMNPLVFDSNLDPDGDWVSNYDEYKGGSDPYNIFSFPILSINIFYAYLLLFLLFILISIGILLLFKYIYSHFQLYKKRIGAVKLFTAFQVWKGHFKSFEEYRKAKQKGASNAKQFLLIQETSAPNYSTALEIKQANFIDFEEYLNAKVVGASTKEEYNLVLKYRAPDLESALLTDQGNFLSYEDYKASHYPKRKKYN